MYQGGLSEGNFKCMKCKLVKKASDMTIDYYEKLLPSNENQKRAIVYELVQPIPLACQRDALPKVFTCFCADLSHNSVGYLWRDDNRVYNFCLLKHEVQKIGNRIIQLGSTTKHVFNTHYNKTNISDIDMYTDLTVNNGYNTILMHGKNKLKAIN